MLASKRQNKLAKAIKLALVCGTLGSVTLAPNTIAQEIEGEDDDSQRVVITGSRLKRSNLVTSSPVTTVGAEDFQIRGITRVEDLLNQLPQVYPGQVSGTANGATGTATVDLRFLGPQRTLTLMNGRRLPTGSPQGGGAGADINQIPGALIDRVELLTGGSSATYGSDAVAGVVNFIMKDDFEGVELDYQYSFYQHDNDNGAIQDLVESSGFETADDNATDGDTHNFSFIWGANSADGKGNITAYASVREVDAITQDKRDYSSCALNLDASNNLVCAGSGTIPEGRVTDFAGGFDFQVDGDQFVPFNTLYNYGPLNHWQRPDKRKTAGFFAKYEVSEMTEVYSEFNFMDDRTNAQIAPSGAFFVTNTLPCGNPFLSQQQFDRLCGDFGLTVNDVQTAYIGRRNVEGGPRNDDLRHTSNRYVVGWRGDINDSWSFDMFANYSNVSMQQVYNNDLSITKITRALDARLDTGDADGDGLTDDVVCQSVIDGSDPTCVPWNVFETGAVTQAMVNYLVLPLYAEGDTYMQQNTAFVTGDLTDAGWVFPAAENGVTMLFGYEYRKERLRFRPDSGFTSGDGAGQGGPTTSVDGKLSVDEFFTEFSLPIVEDRGWAEALTVDLAYRYSDYSTDKQTDTYKVALDWTINDMWKVRGSFQAATRHANIRELFVPQSLGLYNDDEDPCAGATPTFTSEQCARMGVDPSRYGTIADSPAGQYNGLFGGNPDLDPEDSETLSFGLIVSPTDNLDMAFDYFNITLDGAIGTVSPDTIYNKCGIENDPTFCALISRGPSQTLWVAPSFVVQTNVNTGSLETEGIDFDISYLHEFDRSRLNFNLLGTYLTDWTNEPVPGEGFIDCLGFWDRTSCTNPTPEWRWNLVTTWSTPWDWAMTGTIRYASGTDELNDGPTDLDASTYLDVAATWDVNNNVALRFGINNLFDEEPEIIPNAPSGVGNGNTFPGSFDTLGRYIFAGVTWSL